MAKNLKRYMAFDWLLITSLFFLALLFLPAYTGEALRTSFILLFGYLAAMFGVSWKYLWMLLGKS